MRKNGLKSLIIIAIGLFFIIICLLVYKNFFYDKKTDKMEDTTSIVGEEKNIEEIEVDSKDVKNAMKALDKIKIKEINAYGKVFDVSKITNYELLDTAFTGMLEDGIVKSACSTEKASAITIEEINSKLKELFNKDYNIKISDIEKVGEESEPGSNILLIGKFDIEIDESKIYVHTPCDADSGFNFINKNVVKVEREGNKLYVYAKVAFGIYDFALVEYFDDYTRDNRIEAKEVEDYPDVDIDKIPANWDSYKTYKYSFNIVGSKYYINKIELSK